MYYIFIEIKFKMHWYSSPRQYGVSDIKLVEASITKHLFGQKKIKVYGAEHICFEGLIIGNEILKKLKCK